MTLELLEKIVVDKIGIEIRNHNDRNETRCKRVFVQLSIEVFGFHHKDIAAYLGYRLYKIRYYYEMFEYLLDGHSYFINHYKQLKDELINNKQRNDRSNISAGGNSCNRSLTRAIVRDNY